MAESSTRPIFPQAPRGFSFTPVNPEPREKQRNYVFVDEHNRHRRLKVMRACGACRRRKIKCDAATTNVWPCGPCVKQQLECIPPTADKDDGNDGDYSYQHQESDLRPTKQDPNTFYDNSIYSSSINSASSYNASHNRSHSHSASYGSEATPTSWQVPGLETFSQTNMPPGNLIPQPQQNFEQPSNWQPPPLTKSTSATSDGSWSLEQADTDIASALGDLKISEDAIAPYITNQRNTLAEGPAVEEREVILPPSTTSHNSFVGVPIEMMPSESDAMNYFAYYFSNIHPYVPVINPTVFYEQWRHNRQSISPLILEGIFGCATQMLGENELRSRWLALGQKHEESFKDVPRLSTIQGLIVLLKAREAVPKRGYYYRSWMTIQYLISMAKDLDLDKHYQAHRSGSPCHVADGDCPIKTRIWHTLFQLELMVGGPQGRTEYNVKLDTVDYEPPTSSVCLTADELRISQDQTYMIRIIKNVRITVSLYASLKGGDPGWASDSDFVAHNRDFHTFIATLPQHLRVDYPPNGSLPWLDNHYVANLHCYSLLSIIMHHRPQLQGPGAITMGDSWRKQVKMCHDAAVKICLLQEATLEHFGLNGFLSMLRGINVSIYTILTCTMLHLVAITSPDPELNRDAKDYFTRHMRILETCSKEWPMPAMQVQIDSLRQAFSADLQKPFELKPNFPYGSPRAQVSTPSEDSYSLNSQQDNIQATNQSTWGPYDQATITPPRTASTVSNVAGYQPLSNSVENMSNQNNDLSLSLGMTNPQYQWNPSKVMESWNTAFSQSAFESPSPGMPNSQSISTPQSVSAAPMYSVQQAQDQSLAQNYQLPLSVSAAQQDQMPVSQPQSYTQISQATQYAPITAQPYITPSMWQDVVANSYGVGSKRRWNDGAVVDYGDETYKRMR